MKKFLTLVVISGVLVGVFYLVGMVLPRTKSVSARATFKSDTEKVFAVVSDVEHWSHWNPTFQSVVASPDKNGHPVWTLTDRKLKHMTFEIALLDGPLKMSGGFETEGARGNVRFELKKFGDGTILRITEQRDIRSPWGRSARLFRNEYAPLMVFLESLGQRLGEPPVTAEAL